MLNHRSWLQLTLHVLWAFCLTGGVCFSPPLLSRATEPDKLSEASARVGTDLRFLSSDELAGRDVGSQGIALAGQYIAERFAELGLKTDSFNGGPFQEFTIPGPPALGADEKNQLHFSGVAELPNLVLGEHYTPVTLGSSGAFAGEVVFAGYGISAPELNYDDYAELDVAGKVVIVLRKEPNQDDPRSKFDGQKPSQHAFFSTKELNAALHKAAALLIVNDQVTVRAAGQDQLPEVAGAGSAMNDKQIPTIYCLRSVVDKLLQTAGVSLEELEAAIDAQPAPRSFALTGIHCHGETELIPSQIPVRNVIGLLPGNGSLADEFIVVGAHYDHVGMGGVGSLAPGTVEIHNGADDNASGSTALLEVARILTRSPPATDPRRSIVFVAFTAEERGLLGSKHYVRNPRWPLEQTVAMLNMDMVGRMEADYLTVYGTGTATQFDSLVDRLSSPTGLVIDKQPAGFGPSDHSTFYEQGIPVFHFFTGLHNDYHRPSDDYEKANLQGIARIADLVADITNEIALLPERPTLVKNATVAQINRPAGPPRAVLGVRLAADPNAAAQIAAVVPGGAAEMAGLQSGDYIVAIADKPVASIRDLQNILRKLKPGESVSVHLHRGETSLQINVVLQGG